MSRYAEHKQAKQKLNEIAAKLDNCLVIHYSCESFYDIENDRTPRITSIAIMDLQSGQVTSFSIHKVAEKNKVNFESIEGSYDKLEKQMLDDYFEFISPSSNRLWLHWNMRDMQFGFKAIEHRYEVLGGEPVHFPDEGKIDIADLMTRLYGKDYAGHPRLVSLMKMNPTIANAGFLTGKEEAEAFENKEFAKLHYSTLRKVQVFADILNRAINSELKTKSSVFVIYGATPQGVFELIRNKWWAAAISYLVALLLGGIITKMLFG